MYTNLPEPSAEPPQYRFMTANGCLHEVYDGEDIYEFESRTYCEECLRDKIFEMTTRELAALVGSDWERVEFGGRT
jgi:hypothetical protein